MGNQIKDQVPIRFTNVGANINIFPVTNFQITKVAAEYILSLYFDDGSSDPDLCIPICLSELGLKAFKEQCIEFKNTQSGNKEYAKYFKSIENYEFLEYKVKKSNMIIQPNRINVFLINLVNDTINITFGYIHPIMITGKESVENPIKIVPSSEISMSIDLFQYLIVRMNDILKG